MLNARLVSKIVARVTHGSVKPSSYSVAQVRQAFAQAEEELTDEMLLPWTNHAAHKVIIAARDAEAREINRARMERNLAHHAARKVARKKAKDEAIARAEAHQADVAAAAGRETFDALMEAGGEELVRNPVNAPVEGDAVEGDAVDPPAVIDYASMTSKELRALAKARGLKGYSGLKKAALVQLLLDNDENPAPLTAAPTATAPARET